MRIVVIGAGYVGLAIAGGFAKLAHHVTLIERDRARVDMIRRGQVPFHEPEMPALLAAGLRSGMLRVAETGVSAAADADIVFVAVGTPAGPDGDPDLSAVDDVVGDLARLPRLGVVALKSTIPVGTTARVQTALGARGRCAGIAYTPEFLSEGTAVADFFHPHRVIIGTASQKAAKLLSALYQPFHCPILVTDAATAEMTKYAANAFLATRISFINEIAMFCERTGADVSAVAAGLGLDPRVGPHFLRAGIGFGGSCLPKDICALRARARRDGIAPTLLDAVWEVNDAVRRAFVEKVAAVLAGLAGRTVAALGLAFKGGTSDLRESPALDIVARLAARGAAVRAYDPAAGPWAAGLVPGLLCYGGPYEAARGADAVLLLTDSAEFARLDWSRLRRQMRRPLALDGRGLGLASAAESDGFSYVGPGQSAPFLVPVAGAPLRQVPL
ncbi:MAG TPA: UDP-glucose/GDP-mannose dehydrogenase family protein [bacterium]|nr:UDP-glucose/GDP-mannose dehydrogenase family protein [bacterium]